MGDIGFTPSQQRVIDERGKNILVSAAAGSGKTAVLSERVVKRVTEKEGHIDIDRILVLTFTRQAAHEMKERIRERLFSLYRDDPFDLNLRRQMTLLDNAKITTIDSFCSYIFKNYFEDINADPNLKIADKSELSVLTEDVMKAFLEEKYESGDGDFLKAADYFSRDVKSSSLSEAILTILEPTVSAAWPKRYLSDMLKPYSYETAPELENSSDFQFFTGILAERLKNFVSCWNSFIDAYTEDDAYHKFFTEERQYIKAASECRTYSAMQSVLSSYTAAKLTLPRSGHKKEEWDDELKKKRTEEKGKINKFIKDYFEKSIDEVFLSIKRSGEYARILVKLSEEFYDRLYDEKMRRGVMDFSDFEHMALSILVDEETGEKKNAALELSSYFDEIMVDEYQDSNSLQETILKSLVTEDEGFGNYFMVGDMKQSIYRFRHADPSIFAGKYESFSVDGGRDRLILLDKNFRSRKDVIDSVNAVFARVMKKDLGGIEYTKAEELKPGADFPEDEDIAKTEIHLLNWPAEADERAGFLRKSEFEASHAAELIEELMLNHKVYDRKNECMRALKLSDIVILSRSSKAVFPELSSALKKRGITLSMVEKENYLLSREAASVLALLSIIDNPRDDLSLAAALKSSIGGFSDEELLLIREEKRDGAFFEAFRQYASDESHKKAFDFSKLYAELRKRSLRGRIRELIEYIYERTGILELSTAMPGGKTRRENLMKLLSLADSYEKVSSGGLFGFMRYVKRQQEYLSPSSGAQGDDDLQAVRLMTIHKSKGLQFPVVILYGAGRQFSNAASSNDIFVSPGNGVFTNDYDSAERTFEKTLSEKIAKLKEKADNRGEEMRLLYVALTRAQEKLIITGSCDPEKIPESLQDNNYQPSFSERLDAASYLDYILPAACCDKKTFVIKNVLPSADEEKDEEKKERRFSIVPDKDFENSDIVKDYYKRAAFVYPHSDEVVYRTKYSVSELKSRETFETVKEAEPLYTEPLEKVKYVPVFMGGERKLSRGSARGTAFHRFLECFDFKLDDLSCAYEKELLRMRENELISPDEEKLLEGERIKRFLSSDLSFRMHKAALENKLFREKAFVMERQSSDIPGEENKNGKVLIQGIVDSYFIEDDEIVILDYKTDRVKSMDVLSERYAMQLMMYGDAISKGTGKNIKELLIYSFELGVSENVK